MTAHQVACAAQADACAAVFAQHLRAEEVVLLLRPILPPLVPAQGCVCTKPIPSHTHTCARMHTHAHACTRMHTHAHACTRMHTHLSGRQERSNALMRELQEEAQVEAQDEASASAAACRAQARKGRGKGKHKNKKEKTAVAHRQSASPEASCTPAYPTSASGQAVHVRGLVGELKQAAREEEVTEGGAEQHEWLYVGSKSKGGKEGRKESARRTKEAPRGAGAARQGDAGAQSAKAPSAHGAAVADGAAADGVDAKVRVASASAQASSAHPGASMPVSGSGAPPGASAHGGSHAETCAGDTGAASRGAGVSVWGKRVGVGVAGAVVERQPTTHVVAQQEHDQQRAQHVSQDPATDMGARASGDKATSDGEYPDLAAALSRVRALAAALPPPFQPLSGAVRILNRCWCVSVCVCVCYRAQIYPSAGELALGESPRLAQRQANALESSGGLPRDYIQEL